MDRPGRDPFEDWEEVDTGINNIRLHMLKGDKKISDEEYLTLMKMNNSPDKENTEVVKAIVEIKDKDD
jgi:hypothetical protein